MNFKEIKNEYKPVPFWSWNEKLTPEETKRQVRLMHEAGIGGFFMHARGGLQTEYMGEEWFQNVEAAIEQAEELGMKAWAYDENGWPSGFGGGKVNGVGVKYQQKYLRISDNEPKENTICKCGNHWFYYDINPFYVDTLCYEAISEFIKVSYEPYYERYKNRIEGFFTDEPQISRNGIPWSFAFEEEYKKRYNEDINSHLEELFLPVGDYKATRMKFWKMVTALFSENFMKQIYEWCNERGLKLTGHLVLEENLLEQLTSNGACMPHYEYMHIPGMDWLGRRIYNCLTQKQLTSVCEQMGKDIVLTESFALCGHNVSFDELKGIYEWQMVRGVNLLCQHLEGYSIRGLRKRDYPPAMYCQQPWWAVYDKFNESMSRTGMILSSGRKSADVLVIHPQTTAWTMYDDKNNAGISELNARLQGLSDTLEAKHIEYHFGDETMIERHGMVEGDKFVIGSQTYSYVITECCETMFDSTKELLDKFVKNGGKVVTADSLAANDIVDNPDIAYTKRAYDGYNIHYFVNTSNKSKYAKFNLNGRIINTENGEFMPFSGEYEFKPWGSVMILEDGTKNVEPVKKSENAVTMPKSLKVSKPVENALTLDYCDYYFDGVLQEKNGYVLNITQRAAKLEKPVKLHQDYFIKAEYVPDKLYLVCETPEIFEISVNGERIEKNVSCYFRDKSFNKIEISRYFKVGENVISFDCDFVQSKEFYENHRNSYIFESEKNKLSYDMEAEAVYLVGDFGLKTDGNWENLDNNSVRYSGGFVITNPKTEIVLSDIEKQGFPFFSGELTVSAEVDIPEENPVLSLSFKGINAVQIEIGGKRKTLLSDGKISLEEFGVKGKNEMKLTLINNLRNLLGPHHLKEGECFGVGPDKFFKESCVWSASPEDGWDDNYCFVETGII